MADIESEGDAVITLDHAEAISFEKIATLAEEFQDQVKRWYTEVCKQGIKPYIYEGLRPSQRQTELYAQGRDTGGPIVTHAKAGQSFHNYGQAFDWVPLTESDKSDGMFDCDWDNDAVYKTASEIATRFGMRTISNDTPHLENDKYVDWRQLWDLFPGMTS